jgi:hypothetical protein
MPTQPIRPRELEWQVFRGSTAVAEGLLTGNQLRSSAWARVRHDVYADARLDRDHALGCRATLARLPAGSAVLAGPSAAFLHGVWWAAAPDDAVHVNLVPDRRVGSQGGVRVHRVKLDPADVTTIGGSPVTTAARTAWDLAVWLPLPQAVAIIDALVRGGRLTRDDLDDVAARLADRPGGRLAAHAFSMVDPASPTAAESRLRVRLTLAGLPLPAVHLPVELAAGRVAVLTLAWPDYQVALDPLDAEPEVLVEPDVFATPDEVDPLERPGTGWLVLPAGPRRTGPELPALVCDIRDALTARGWTPTWRARTAAHRPAREARTPARHL